MLPVVTVRLLALFEKMSNGNKRILINDRYSGDKSLFIGSGSSGWLSSHHVVLAEMDQSGET